MIGRDGCTSRPTRRSVWPAGVACRAPMWACLGCGQSIAEVAVGLHVPDGAPVSWLVVGARCVACGRLAGLTDLVVPDLPLDELLATL